MKQLLAIERLVAARPELDRVIARVQHLPIHALSFGPAADVPLFIVVGGVHGNEQIGTEVAIAFLETLIARAAPVDHRIVVVPLLNPVGMARNRRANGNGVDLMRNAPPHALGGTPLLGGQRRSRWLPWYMGPAGAPMEVEAAALVELVEAECASAPFCLALDLHFGFGLANRLWYPYARSREPIADLPAIHALGRLLDTALPGHRYRYEQTAQVYTIRGDLWDHLYDRRRCTLLPLTLEIGVRSRRHLPLIDALVHATASYRAWLPR